MTGPRYPNAPARMLARPTDHRGFPVPWFVAWFDGKPDFRVADQAKMRVAVTHEKCWLCGEKLGRFKAFVIGPMCAINRISSEPPSHKDCAVFAATACPFLIQPKMRRNEKDIPTETHDAAGVGLKRNPGATLVWVTTSFRLVKDGRGGVLFGVGDPIETLWFAEGREATRAEVEASIESGLPLLREPAEAQGPHAVAYLEQLTAKALKLLPRAA